MLTANTLLPWQVSQWQLLWQIRKNQRLPHALLLSGQTALEEKFFAEKLALALLCEKNHAEGEACLGCRGCHFMQAGSHPDFVRIEPEKAGQMIKIDQIRDLTHFVNETSMQGGFKVILIVPAHAMNLAAANALLKTLEEPTPQTFIILCSAQNARMPATLVSRCQKLHLPKPDKVIALKWLLTHTSIASEEHAQLLLQLAEYSPLQALAWHASHYHDFRVTVYQGLLAMSAGEDNISHYAEKWQTDEPVIFLNLLLKWLQDLLRIKLANEAVIYNCDFRTELTALAVKISLKEFLTYLDEVTQRYKNIVTLQNVNKQLLLEELLIRWTYVSR